MDKKENWRNQSFNSTRMIRLKTQVLGITENIHLNWNGRNTLIIEVIIIGWFKADGRCTFFRLRSKMNFYYIFRRKTLSFIVSVIFKCNFPSKNISMSLSFVSNIKSLEWRLHRWNCALVIGCASAPFPVCNE